MIQATLADMAADVEAARLLVYHAAWLKDQGQPATQATSIAKLFATEAAVRAASEAVLLHGNRGYSNEYPVERYYRDIKGLQIYEGTSHIQRIIIARELIGREHVSIESGAMRLQRDRAMRGATDGAIPSTGIPRTRRCHARTCSALQLVKLQRMCEWAYANSPFHQQRWDAAGFHPDQLKTLDDLRRIPFMTREEWMESHGGTAALWRPARPPTRRTPSATTSPPAPAGARPSACSTA